MGRPYGLPYAPGCDVVAHRYERCISEWLPFTHRTRTFYEGLARDLGYELHELEGGPGELIF